VRFVKFAIVGVGNTVVAFAVFHVASVWLGLPPLAGNALGWLAGFVNSFVWNRAWTFADRGRLPAAHVLPRFAVTTLVAIAVSSGVIALSNALFGLGGRGAAALDATEVAAIAAALVVNYLLASRWAVVARKAPGSAGRPRARSSLARRSPELFGSAAPPDRRHTRYCSLCSPPTSASTGCSNARASCWVTSITCR